jgi:hypothetical protein
MTLPACFQSHQRPFPLHAQNSYNQNWDLALKRVDALELPAKLEIG